jgi:superfamily II DNA or RNA helicase
MRENLDLTVKVTGARPGDILIGTSPSTKNCVIKIHNFGIGPEKEILDEVRSSLANWKTFLTRLNSIKFFSEMSSKEKEKWIETNEDSEHNMNILGMRGQKIEILQPGVLFEKIGESRVLSLIENQLDFADIYSAIPGTTGLYFSKEEILKSKKFHTLFLIRSFWSIGTDYSIVKSANNVVNVEKGICYSFKKCRESKEIILVDIFTKQKTLKMRSPSGAGHRRVLLRSLEKEQIGFLVSSERGILSNERMDELIISLFSKIFSIEKEVLCFQIGEIRHLLRNFPPSAHKSLIQKIIRFAPKFVKRENKSYDSRLFLIVSFISLLSSPGSFVPDIQRFVSGIESATKRLAVSIFEDSSLMIEKGDCLLLSLLSGSILSQRMKNWCPSYSLIEKWCLVAIEALNSKFYYKYENLSKTKEKYYFSIENSPLENCSALLNEIKSFETDEEMVRQIASDTVYLALRNNPSVTSFTKNLEEKEKFFKIMELGHCVDQHWAPGIVYFYPFEIVKKISKNNKSEYYRDQSSIGKPFSKLFSSIWDHSSKLNPRKSFIGKILFSDFFRETKLAQNYFLSFLQVEEKKQLVFSPDLETFVLEYKLDSGWLPAMVGAIKVKVGTANITVTMKADDPTILIPIRTPSRDKKPPLTAEEEISGIEKAKELLRKGVNMNQASPPISSLENCKVYLKSENSKEIQEEFFIKTKNGELIEWDKFLDGKIEYPIEEEKKYDSLFNLFHNSGNYFGIGVIKNCLEKFDKVLQKVEFDTIQRVLYYLTTFSSTIEINRISRDGSGTYKAVTLSDVSAFQILLKISLIFPGALRPMKNRIGVFEVVSQPLLWHVKECIEKFILKRRKDSQEQSSFDDQLVGKSQNNWNYFFDLKKRVLWEHQKDVIEEMIEGNRRAKKGHFIWLEMGMGKTLCVLEYLSYLRKNKTLSKYILYSLPESAMAGVIEEIQNFGIPINIILPIKTGFATRAKKYKLSFTDSITQNLNLVPFVINLIEHDKLRVGVSHFSEYASETIFIIDEVHKALNETQRTSAALELATLSQEFITLTGTPVIDNDTFKLVQWLSMIVNFEVNEKNFWVAASSMISKQASTGIKTEHTEVEVEITDKNYWNLIPIGMGGTNKRASISDLKEATRISFDAMDIEMIKQVVDLVKNEGRGTFLVAKDKSHQQKLFEMLSKCFEKTEDIFSLPFDQSINLTDENIQKGIYPNYKVVIIPLKRAEGYTMTALSAMVSGAYPSNQATRTQIEARINRIGQKAKLLKYVKVHGGILSWTLYHHNEAKNIEIALKSMSEI